MRTSHRLAIAIAALAALACTTREPEQTTDTAAGGLAATTPAVTTGADDLDDWVEDALDADTSLRPFDLDAEEEDGRLVLEGSVRTAEQKALAEQIAGRSAPGTTIDNRLEVSATARMRAGDDDDDDEPEDRVEDALEADTALAAFDLDADDRSGGIVLQGTVRTAEQKTLAEAIAKRIAPGVTIDNRIRVQ